MKAVLDRTQLTILVSEIGRRNPDQTKELGPITANILASDLLTEIPITQFYPEFGYIVLSRTVSCFQILNGAGKDCATKNQKPGYRVYQSLKQLAASGLFMAV